MTATNLDTPAEAPLISLADFHILLADQHPFSMLLGIDVLHIGHGTARAALPARDAHQRLGGIVAGPMLMGLADLTMYAAVVGATGQAHAVTASLTINFLRKSPAGAIYADARLLKVGRLSAGEVILTGEGSDEPLAHIVSTWSVPKP
ncbi:PaaI family thioesterase [Achromobacter denitrificans]